MFVSVVIPTYNRLPILKKCLKALENQSYIDEIVDLLKKLASEQSCSVLMVTHDPRILDVADRLLRMEDGQILPTV